MKYKSEIFGAFILAALFLLAGLLADRYQDVFRSLLSAKGYWGMAGFVLAHILATVIAPISTLPLLPIAVVVWGPLVVATLSTVAWTIGAMIAFLLARTFGAPLVKKMTNTSKLHKYEMVLSKRDMFWTILFLRMAVPVDILSYAIGLFSSVGWRTYITATFLGIIPFALIFSYSAGLPIPYQIGAWLLALLAIFLSLHKIKKSI